MKVTELIDVLTPYQDIIVRDDRTNHQYEGAPLKLPTDAYSYINIEYVQIEDGTLVIYI